MTKQRRWQLKMVAAGRCSQCGKPRQGYRQLCDKCGSKQAKYMRNARRKKLGIPLNRKRYKRGPRSVNTKEVAFQNGKA